MRAGLSIVIYCTLSQAMTSGELTGGTSLILGYWETTMGVFWALTTAKVRTKTVKEEKMNLTIVFKR